ncbi:MAG TPA: hypothetical protein VJA46_06845 [Acidimicrobiia bacterium]|nr:hypothetical protein [Acidimicrobiia bacterium]
MIRWNLLLRRPGTVEQPAPGAEIKETGRPLIHPAAPTRDRRRPDVIDEAVHQLLADTGMYGRTRR